MTRIAFRQIRLSIVAVSFCLIHLPCCISKRSGQSFNVLRRREVTDQEIARGHYWHGDQFEKNVDTRFRNIYTSSASSADNGEQQTLNPYWDTSYWFNLLSNTYWDVDIWRHADIGDNVLRAAETEFVDQCLTALEDAAVNNKVIGNKYVKVLREISKGSLSAKKFNDLPLFLSMIFFSAACSSGEDCVDEEPAMTTASIPAKEREINIVLCRQLMRFPFIEVVFPFQFLIRTSDNVTAEDLMAQRDSNQILPKLEVALTRVLLEGLGCSYNVSRQSTPRQNPKKDKDPSLQRQPQPQDGCDFVVNISVGDAADYRKLMSHICFNLSSIFIFLRLTLYHLILHLKPVVSKAVVS